MTELIRLKDLDLRALSKFHGEPRTSNIPRMIDGINWDVELAECKFPSEFESIFNQCHFKFQKFVLEPWFESCKTADDYHKLYTRAPRRLRKEIFTKWLPVCATNQDFEDILKKVRNQYNRVIKVFKVWHGKVDSPESYKKLHTELTSKKDKNVPVHEWFGKKSFTAQVEYDWFQVCAIRRMRITSEDDLKELCKVAPSAFQLEILNNLALNQVKKAA